MANKKVLIWVSALAALAICGLCAIAIALGESDSEPTAELSQASAIVTTTATATATEAPQLSPTVTPLPTGTANDQAILYFEAITPHILYIGEALGDLGDLLKAPGADENWGWRVAEAMAIIRVSHVRLSEIVPPPEVAYIHKVLLDAAQDCNDMTSHLAVAIDTFDENEFDKASELTKSCVEKANEVQLMIERFAK